MEKECVKKGAVKNCLSIAGVDPSGGAGVLADIKAMSACGVYAMGVVTALTAQNTRGVTGVMPVPADFVGKELEAVFTDVPPAAVKIGMLNDAAVIGVVAGALRRYKPRWVVLDPVMVAKSGDRLLREDALEALKTELLPLADIVTPNLPEAGDLLGRTVETKDAMAEAAEALSAMMKAGGAVLLKGGHLEASSAASDLFYSRGETFWIEAPRTATKNTHGTGCTLSSALAAFLARTDDATEAVRLAKAYIAEAIATADRLSVGSGHGPVHHFVRLWQTETPSLPRES